MRKKEIEKKNQNKNDKYKKIKTKTRMSILSPCNRRTCFKESNFPFVYGNTCKYCKLFNYLYLL